MRSKHFRILVFLLLVWILALSFVFFKIYNGQRVLGLQPVIPLNRNVLGTNSAQELQFYYEPVPYAKDPLQIALPTWLKSTPKYSINSEGIHSPKEFPLVKPEGTVRIVTLGDSFTFGQYVDTEFGYPQVLEGLFEENPVCGGKNKYEVINLGVPGYDIQYAIERFRLHGQKYNPDLVIWFLKDDDFIFLQDNIEARVTEYKKQGFDQKKAVLAAVESFNHEFSRSEVLKSQEELLTTMDKYFQGKLLFITFPSTDSKYKEILLDVVGARPDTYFLDQLTDIGKEKLVLPDNHPNEEGHAEIAKDVFSFIKNNNIVECR